MSLVTSKGCHKSNRYNRMGEVNNRDEGPSQGILDSDPLSDSINRSLGSLDSLVLSTQPSEFYPTLSYSFLISITENRLEGTVFRFQIQFYLHIQGIYNCPLSKERNKMYAVVTPGCTISLSGFQRVYGLPSRARNRKDRSKDRGHYLTTPQLFLVHCITYQTSTVKFTIQFVKDVYLLQVCFY